MRVKKAKEKPPAPGVRSGGGQAEDPASGWGQLEDGKTEKEHKHPQRYGFSCWLRGVDGQLSVVSCQSNVIQSMLL
ncbi:hypothetical protein CDA63_10690 [Hymenobacter amundsenii]|uniref:Uncharacterized protein n=1 Tax=Hymenobacter amundsenii TaxID=2006685 RepID=A0A246FNI2_9BACT|nr:hypothetical protein CDA63_10690 [Hymenobacter amundsenii]